MSPRPLIRAPKRRAKASRWMPEQLRHALSSFLSKLYGGVIIAFGLIILLSLVSYTPTDNSFNAASANQISNIFGTSGSLFADILWQYFGMPSVLLALILMSWGWRISAGRGIDFFWGRCLAAIIAVLASGMVLVALAPEAALGQTHFWGGTFSKMLAAPFRRWLPSVWGGRVIAFSMALLALGTLYMASALTFEEWQNLGRWIKELLARLSHDALAWAQDRWCKIRNWRTQDENYIDEASDDEDEELDEEEGDEKEEKDTGEEENDDEEELEDEPSGLEKFFSSSEKKQPRTIVQLPTKTSKQTRLSFAAYEEYIAPPLDLLQWPDPKKNKNDNLSESALEKNARMLESVLSDFGVHGEITKVSPGPVVTLYELEPSPGTRSSRIISLADDIARNMSATSVRVAVVPGRNVIGIELPNKNREFVFLRELMCTPDYNDHKGILPLVLGKDISGAPIITDLSRMPHLLIAGTTGSGKSVAVNTMILSLIYRLPPQKCRFIMIDPKVLELSVYEGIPHLLAPVVTEPKKAIVALKWTTREMEERYRAMAKLGVRNIDGYNIRLQQAAKSGENLTRTIQTGYDRETGKPIYEEQPLDLTPLPYIVVVVDEMADLMMTAGKEIEASIQRLAQKARAAGIHLIMATQRPSVDVITGTIKANFPIRISFQVISKIDSRTILGEQGAEQLLGMGDMLYMAGGGRVTRVHGPFVTDDEVEMVVKHLKEQGEPEYLEEITEEDESDEELSGNMNSGDELYDKAVDIVLREQKASISFVQRHLKIGYNRAATLIERMEKEGLIGEADRVGRRQILARSGGGD
ncbi:MAG: DNA translocase FtsK [Bdellovibrionales bacterium]